MEKKEQIEKMNLEVKENLKLTDEEYEKTKDVLSRLNEIELEANPELIEKVQIDNESRIIYAQDIDQNKAAFLLNDVKLDYTAEFTSLIKFNKEINDIYWKVNEGIELDLFIKEKNMSELEWSILNEMRKNILLEERLSEDNFDNISGMSLLASFMENVYLDAMGEKPIFVLNLDRLVKYLNTKIPF